MAITKTILPSVCLLIIKLFKHSTNTIRRKRLLIINNGTDGDFSPIQSTCKISTTTDHKTITHHISRNIMVIISATTPTVFTVLKRHFYNTLWHKSFSPLVYLHGYKKLTTSINLIAHRIRYFTLIRIQFPLETRCV